MKLKVHAESGETLAELLVTIAIVGIAVVLLVGGLATAIKASVTHRQLSAGDTVTRNVAELFKNQDPLSPAKYVSCATSYPTTGVDGLGQFNVEQQISYWGRRRARCPTTRRTGSADRAPLTMASS